VSAILAVLEQRDGALRKVSHEIVTAARRLADAHGGTVDALVLAAGAVTGADQLGRFGADRVVTATHALLERYAPEAAAHIVAERVKTQRHEIVLFPASAMGKDLAPRVAARLAVPLVADATDVAIEGGALVAVRPTYAGKALLKVRVVARPAALSLRPNVFTPVEHPRTAEAQTVKVELPEGPGRVVVREVKAAPGGALDVGEAVVVISGGRGLREPASFQLLEDLARAFGGHAAVGASRAVVDAGWRPHADQVGQTGKTVSPPLYIAVGISGAIQHLAGMRTSKVIVAINKDKDAPIFKIADYGIVGDLFAIVPRLTEEIKKLHG
jgi:electron transfer flavoprotein alpha subunit